MSTIVHEAEQLIQSAELVNIRLNRILEKLRHLNTISTGGCAPAVKGATFEDIMRVALTDAYDTLSEIEIHVHNFLGGKEPNLK